jgi:glycerophosphoryl diester phosphodiesterase
MRPSQQLCLLLLMPVVAAAATGCMMSKSTVGLDELLITEGRNYGTRYTYRCTRGAHRGSSQEHKENTMDALLAADSDKRYAFVEFDVQYSKDDRIVVFHDQSMLRTFGSPRKIEDSTFAELLTVTGGRIAEFHDVMRLARKRMNIEIKSQGDHSRDVKLVDEVMAEVLRRKLKDRVVISSISGDVVKYVNDKYPGTPTGQIFWLKSSTYLHIDALTEGLYDKIEETGADYLMLHVANLRNIDDLLKLKPGNKTLVFWGFDDRMYVVHKDMSDRVWGCSWFCSVVHETRYRTARFWRWLTPWD